MSKYKSKYEIDKFLLYKFACSGLDSTFNIYNLGWWLETKTEEQFTVIQTQIIEDTLKLFNRQISQIKLFRDILLKNADYLRRKSDIDSLLKGDWDEVEIKD